MLAGGKEAQRQARETGEGTISMDGGAGSVCVGDSKRLRELCKKTRAWSRERGIVGEGWRESRWEELGMDMNKILIHV